MNSESDVKFYIRNISIQSGKYKIYTTKLFWGKFSNRESTAMIEIFFCVFLVYKTIFMKFLKYFIQVFCGKRYTFEKTLLEVNNYIVKTWHDTPFQSIV